MKQGSAKELDEAVLSFMLRPGLELLPAMPDADGAPGWLLSDPAQHRYFHINQATFHILTVWQEKGYFGDALIAFCEESGEDIDDAEVLKLLDFVRKGNLLDNQEAGSWRHLAMQADRASAGRLKRLAAQYLFFKIPLFRPQGMLERALPYVQPLMSKAMVYAIGLLSLLALYLVSRQWDAFLGSVSIFLSPQGAIGFLLALVGLKVAHELGHAFVATKFGCRVPVMGVAFMLMTPLLFTDVSDGWKLTSRRKRMLISGAGIMVETAIAAITTCMWAILPDGNLRSIFFMIGSTAWISSLAINLNPLMRFDGYYLLSDWLGLDNLQPRSFALGRWKVRQWLVYPSLLAPEVVPQRLRSLLILYAFVVWAYRLVLFTTIALAVYHFVFKLLGIALFCLEIGLLIILPVVRELKQWRLIIREKGVQSRLKWTCGAFALVFLLLAVPLPGRVAVPAVLLGGDVTRLYAERAGRISAVYAQRNDKLEKGDLLVGLEEPKLEQDIEDARIRLDLAKTRLNQSGASDKEREESLILRQQYSSLQTEFSGLSELKHTTELRARASGTVVQLAPDLHAGRWMPKGALLAIMSARDSYVVQGYVAEPDLEWIDGKGQGRFVPDDLQLSSFAVTMKRLAKANSRQLDIAELASVYGGAIAVSRAESKELVPQVAQYRVDFDVPNVPFHPSQIVRGLVHLSTRPRSLLWGAFEQMLTVLISESGF
nr:hypothetical protein [uncultured Cohaesibacter sp.]